MNGIGDYIRFWPYGAAVLAGIACAVIDRRIIGRYVLGALLIVIAAAGPAGMYLSPFTFGGGDYYMLSLIASVMALAGLAGYTLSAIPACVLAGRCGSAAQ
jgi:hypothetical protein